MGTPKAALEWHGSTLLGRTVQIIARATSGPVVVVRAPGQDLPELPEGTLVVDDPREGRGPVQGIAAGLAALTGHADVAFVSSTDLPFLHPAFIRRVLHALDDREGTDVALPVARGYKQPLAAAYRVSLAGTAERLVQEDRLRPGFLFDECRVETLDDATLKQDPMLAAFDPDLDSVLNVNTPEDYVAARARPQPEVTVRLFGGLMRGGNASGPHAVRAATVGGAADALAVVFDRHVTVTLNGDRITSDRATPLAAGDTVFFASGLVGRAVYWTDLDHVTAGEPSLADGDAPPCLPTSRSRQDAVRSGVDVHGRAAQEPDQGETCFLGQVDGERGRRGDRSEQRDAAQDRLLHQLEGRASADQQHAPGKREPVREERPAHQLVHGVVPADILADRDELTGAGEQSSGVQAARAGEHALCL